MTQKMSATVRMAGRRLCLGIVASAMIHGGSAWAGMVSGVVRNNNISQARKTLEFVDVTRGRTLQSMSTQRGVYTILLPPGFYLLKIDGRECGRVQSSSRPVRLNVEMRACR